MSIGLSTDRRVLGKSWNSQKNIFLELGTKCLFDRGGGQFRHLPPSCIGPTFAGLNPGKLTCHSLWYSMVGKGCPKSMTNILKLTFCRAYLRHFLEFFAYFWLGATKCGQQMNGQYVRPGAAASSSSVASVVVKSLLGTGTIPRPRSTSRCNPHMKSRWKNKKCDISKKT